MSEPLTKITLEYASREEPMDGAILVEHLKKTGWGVREAWVENGDAHSVRLTFEPTPFNEEYDAVIILSIPNVLVDDREGQPHD